MQSIVYFTFANKNETTKTNKQILQDMQEAYAAESADRKKENARNSATTITRFKVQSP